MGSGLVALLAAVGIWARGITRVGLMRGPQKAGGLRCRGTKGVLEFTVAQDDKTTFLAGHGMRDARFLAASITG